MVARAALPDPLPRCVPLAPIGVASELSPVAAPAAAEALPAVGAPSAVAETTVASTGLLKPHTPVRSPSVSAGALPQRSVSQLATANDAAHVGSASAVERADPFVYDWCPLRLSEMEWLQAGVLVPTPGGPAGGHKRGPRALDARRRRPQRWHNRAERRLWERAVAEVRSERCEIRPTSRRRPTGALYRLHRRSTLYRLLSMPELLPTRPPADPLTVSGARNIDPLPSTRTTSRFA